MKTNGYVIYCKKGYSSDYYGGLSFEPFTTNLRLNWEVPFFVYECKGMAGAEAIQISSVLKGYSTKVVNLDYLPKFNYIFIDTEGNQFLVSENDEHKIEVVK